MKSSIFKKSNLFMKANAIENGLSEENVAKQQLRTLLTSASCENSSDVAAEALEIMEQHPDVSRPELLHYFCTGYEVFDTDHSKKLSSHVSEEQRDTFESEYGDSIRMDLEEIQINSGTEAEFYENLNSYLEDIHRYLDSDGEILALDIIVTSDEMPFHLLDTSSAITMDEKTFNYYRENVIDSEDLTKIDYIIEHMTCHFASQEPSLLLEVIEKYKDSGMDVRSVLMARILACYKAYFKKKALFKKIMKRKRDNGTLGDLLS